MTTTQFTVCSYNLQAGSLFLDTDVEDEDKALETLIDSADVYCLQGIENINRPLIQSLKSKNFAIVSVQRAPQIITGEIFTDTVVALSKQRFSDIRTASKEVELLNDSNETIFLGDIAVATAKDNITGQDVVFVSTRSPDADLNFEKHLNVSDITKVRDTYHEAIQEIFYQYQLDESAIQIIGTDVRGNQEEFPCIFEKEGFQRASSGSKDGSSIIFSNLSGSNCILSKILGFIESMIASIFFKSFENHVEINHNENVVPIEDNVANSSPVAITISSTVKNSKIVELFNLICNGFKNLFTTVLFYGEDWSTVDISIN